MSQRINGSRASHAGSPHPPHENIMGADSPTWGRPMSSLTRCAGDNPDLFSGQTCRAPTVSKPAPDMGPPAPKEEEREKKNIPPMPSGPPPESAQASSARERRPAIVIVPFCAPREACRAGRHALSRGNAPWLAHHVNVDNARRGAEAPGRSSVASLFLTAPPWGDLPSRAARLEALPFCGWDIT